eukprot:354169-Chlamydomonas_euryale.AAC.27
MNQRAPPGPLSMPQPAWELACVGTPRSHPTFPTAVVERWIMQAMGQSTAQRSSTLRHFMHVRQVQARAPFAPPARTGPPDQSRPPAAARGPGAVPARLRPRWAALVQTRVTPWATAPR